jgi:hypothetical protein
VGSIPIARSNDFNDLALILASEEKQFFTCFSSMGYSVDGRGAFSCTAILVDLAFPLT